MDFKVFFDLLAEKNYLGPYAVEVFGRGLRDMEPHDAARLAFDASVATLRTSRLASARPSFEGNATAPDSAEV